MFGELSLARERLSSSYAGKQFHQNTKIQSTLIVIITQVTNVMLRILPALRGSGPATIK